MKTFLETKRLIFIWLVGWIVYAGGLARPLQAQDVPTDLTELSLEELMQIDVIPIDVLGSHIHSKGEWMMGYRTMFMQMTQTSHGHDGAFGDMHEEGHGDMQEEGHGDMQGDGFMVLPTDMRMEMHMAEIMYGVTNRLTMMVMLPFERLSMDHQTRTGEHFTTASQGIGDVSIAAHYALKRSYKNYWVALLGMSLPTGSINRRDTTPMGPDQVLPYPMQIGSGTPDLLTGITYIHQRTTWSWGFHADSKVRLGRMTIMVLPTDMRMEMHMAEIMYGVTNRLTMMVMLPFERLSMDHQTRTGEHFTTASQGIGDVSIAAHYALKRSYKNYWVALLGMSLPTGSINRRDTTPMGPDQVLPYPMQIGSGTPDLLTGITYIHQRTTWSWGFHADSKVRLGRNAHQYRLGNEYHVGAWVSRRVTKWFAPTLHVDGHRTGDVHGADPALNPTMVPTADPTLQGDTHLSVVPMLNFHIPRGFLKNQRFTLQGSFPLQHAHTGIPLETKAQVMIAWQWTI